MGDVEVGGREGKKALWSPDGHASRDYLDLLHLHCEIPEDNSVSLVSVQGLAHNRCSV
jgi:hypothetical protein